MKDNKTNEKTYVVYCHTAPNGVYYGVTCNVKNRWHPSRYKHNNTPFKDAIIEFGWENIQHEVLFENLTLDEALKLEDQLIVKARGNGTCLNAHRSGHHTETDEYKGESKARSKARSKAWRENNPEKEKACQKSYREAHPEECKARTKAWREANPDKIKAYQRERRKRNKGNGGKK